MYEHRIRRVESPNPEENPDSIDFIEVEQDRWIEVAPTDWDKITPEQVREFCKEAEGLLGYDSRAFRIYPHMKDYREIATIHS